jgi:hypothetical protein
LNAMPFWNCDSAQLQLQLLEKINIYGTWLFFKMKGIYRKTRTCISEETRHERDMRERERERIENCSMFVYPLLWSMHVVLSKENIQFGT